MDKINKTATVEGYKLFDGFSSIKKIGSKWLSANLFYCKSANITSNALIRRRSCNPDNWARNLQKYKKYA